MRALAALALFAVLAQHSAGRLVTLPLPHPVRAGETVFVELTIGAIERGAEIEITTPSGQLLGVVSPFAIRSGHPAGTYTVPLPSDAISGDRVSLRLSLDMQGGAQRAPTKDEVKSVRVKIVGATP
jgi:hypothetical protein